MEYRAKVIVASKNDGVTLLADGRLEVGVDAPRKEGRANQRTCELVAAYLGVEVADVRVVRGQQQSTKVLHVKNRRG